MLRADLSTEIFQASASTDTGYSLPTTDGTVTVAVGVERRNMSYDRDADTVFEEGQLLGQGGPTASIAGGFNVTDVFFEAAVPVLDNLDAIFVQYMGPFNSHIFFSITAMSNLAK